MFSFYTIFGFAVETVVSLFARYEQRDEKKAGHGRFISITISLVLLHTISGFY